MKNYIEINSNVRLALEEDIGLIDLTGAILPDNLNIKAKIISREAMCLCGQDWVIETFNQVDPNIRIIWHKKEGEWLDSPEIICDLSGPARSILTAERTALNFLQLLSGTATITYKYQKNLTGLATKLLDTRKTIPGLRYAQKYAVNCGGGTNHRFGLYDAFLIKENHIKACGSITNAILAARSKNNTKPILVEVENLLELQEALKLKPDRILLDNFTYDMLIDAVLINNKSCDLEVTGGVNINNIRQIAETGVDFISVGALTKFVHAIDLSLLVQDD